MAALYTKEDLHGQLNEEDSPLNVHLKSLLMLLREKYDVTESKTPQIATLKSNIRTIHLVSISLSGAARPTTTELKESGWEPESSKPSNLYKMIGEPWIVRLVTAVI